MRRLIRLLCTLAGSIWLITTLYVYSSPKLNSNLIARKPESTEREQLLSANLQKLKNKSAPLNDICNQYRLLSIFYFAANSYDKAEDTLLDCLEYVKGRSGVAPPNADYTATYNMMADFWLARADFANAEVLYKKAKAYCPENSFLLAKTTNNLGLLYYFWGETTSNLSLRREKLSQSKDYYQSAQALLKGLKEKVDKNELQFFQKYLSENYQSCLEELSYSGGKIALSH